MNEMENREVREQALSEGRVFAPGVGFTVGGVLRCTLSTLRSHPWLFCGPVISLALAASFRTLVEDSSPVKLVLFILELTLTQIIQGVSVYGVYRTLKGESVSFGVLLKRALMRLPATIAIGVLIVIPVSLGICVSAYLLLWAFGRFGIVLSAVLMFCAVIVSVCFVPIMASVCIVDGLGPLVSIKRGVVLTKGFRLKIVAIYILTFLGATVSSPIVVLIALPFLPLLGNIASLAMLALFMAFLIAFNITLGAVIYCGLREVKEGL